MPTPSDLLWNFRAYVLTWWKLYDKWGRHIDFNLTPAQKLIYSVAKCQQDNGKPIRVRILKYRQATVSTFCTAYMQHRAMTHSGHTALTIADKADLPAQWLRRCHRWYEQTPVEMRPHAGATNANELYFDCMQSRYYIGSAEGKTPGMGATIQSIHCSEIDSWINPDEVLSDLLPALPPGPDTCVFQESTGRAVAGWWYQRYYEARDDPKNEYESIFLPWFIQPEYQDEDGVDRLDDYEYDLRKLGHTFSESEHGKLIDFDTS